MSVRERILTIRLTDKANANPARAEALGIAVTRHPAGAKPHAVLNSGKQIS